MALGNNSNYIRFGNHEKAFNFNPDRAVDVIKKIAEIHSKRNNQYISDRSVRTSSDEIPSEDTASNYVDQSLTRSDTFGSINRNAFRET